MCEVGWLHTYFTHKDAGLTRRPPAGTQRRLSDPGPGDPVVGQQRRMASRSLWRKPAAGSRVALRCLGRSRVQGPGGAPMEGRWGPRGPWRGGHPGCCSAHCCILGPADPDPETLAARLRGQMPVLPAPAAGWGQRPDASPCSADKGGVALLRKVVVTLFPFCKLLFSVGLGRRCLFESGNARRLGDVCA